MPIVHSTPPEGGSSLVQKSLSRLNRGRSLRALSFANRAVKEFGHVQPHKIYTVGLSDLVNGKLLSAAKETGWRYILVADGKCVGEVELGSHQAVSKRGEAALEFRALHESPFAAATVDALNVAEGLDVVKRDEYEVRFLKCIAVYFAALWLHAMNDDLLIPLVTPPPGLDAEKPYSEQEIIAALRPIAERVKAFSESPLS